MSASGPAGRTKIASAVTQSISLHGQDREVFQPLTHAQARRSRLPVPGDRFPRRSCDEQRGASRHRRPVPSVVRRTAVRGGEQRGGGYRTRARCRATRHERITTMTSRCKSAKPVATARWIRTASGAWPTGLRPGKLVIMHATILTYALYGIEAIPADVIVDPDCVRVVERGTGRVLAARQACMLGGLAILGRRRSAPETIRTRQSYYPIHSLPFDIAGTPLS
jgi:hypothetical protein